jgi:excisionase family DNA binding protein
MLNEPIAVSIGEAARLISCGRSTLYQLINKNQIPLLKIGRRSVVPLADLRNFIEAKVKQAEKP